MSGFCSNVKVKRSQSPSVAIKFEPHSDEEDKLKVLREEEEVSLDQFTRRIARTASIAHIRTDRFD